VAKIEKRGGWGWRDLGSKPKIVGEERVTCQFYQIVFPPSVKGRERRGSAPKSAQKSTHVEPMASAKFT